MKSVLAQDFTAQAVHHLRVDFLPKIAHCLDLLTEEEIWWRPNPNSNSVGNLVLHLCGNVRQWVVAGIGKQPDRRQRDLEFATREPRPGKELAQMLRSTVDEAAAVIESLDEAQLMEKRRIQIYDVTALQAVFHVVEHFSCHTGQILYVTKMLKDRDLSFYAQLNKKERG